MHINNLVVALIKPTHTSQIFRIVNGKKRGLQRLRTQLVTVSIPPSHYDSFERYLPHNSIDFGQTRKDALKELFENLGITKYDSSEIGVVSEIIQKNGVPIVHNQLFVYSVDAGKIIFTENNVCGADLSNYDFTFNLKGHVPPTDFQLMDRLVLKHGESRRLFKEIKIFKKERKYVIDEIID